jgi:hypothetical protein
MELVDLLGHLNLFWVLSFLDCESLLHTIDDELGLRSRGNHLSDFIKFCIKVFHLSIKVFLVHALVVSCVV